MRQGPQRYYVPELNIEIKVEYLNNKTYVAHFPGGSERTSYYTMMKEGWVHKGPWIEEQEAV
jgi:hypothetical protein